MPPGSVEVPLSASTRRFLEPIVGLDPASVNVYQAPPGAEATSGVDAVTVGDDVVLAAGQAGESPRVLGLLAHELTHVAHERDAPADTASATPAPAPDMQAAPTAEADTTPRQAGPPRTTPNTDALFRGQAQNPATEPPLKPADDAHGEHEAAARQVESSVIAAAQASAGNFADAAPGAVAQPFPAPGSDLAATHFATAAHAASTHAASTHDDPHTRTASRLTPTALQANSTGPEQAPANLRQAPRLDAQPWDSAISNTTETPPPWDTESRTAAEPPAHADPWGGLPAPWQPLPEWLTSPNAFVTTVDSAGLNGVNGHTTTTSSTNGAGVGSSNGNNTGGNNAGGGGGGAHFADADRSLPPAAPPQAATPTPTPEAPPVEPDLDALAHQVYTILKRRLASERRRLS